MSNFYRDLLSHYQDVRNYLGRFETPLFSRDDLVQETYLRALETVRIRGPPGPVKPWLLTIAKRTGIEGWRRSQMRITESLVAEPVTSEKPEVLDELVGYEERDQVARAIQRLQPAARTLVSAFYFDGRKLVDLEREQALPEGSLRRLLLRARNEIRRRV